MALCTSWSRSRPPPPRPEPRPSFATHRPVLFGPRHASLCEQAGGYLAALPCCHAYRTHLCRRVARSLRQRSGHHHDRGAHHLPRDPPRHDRRDTLHGTFVPDPYRWLENDTSAETADWVKRQNAVTDAYLAKIPFRQAIADRYEELFNYPKVAPAQGGRPLLPLQEQCPAEPERPTCARASMARTRCSSTPTRSIPDGTTSIDLMSSSMDDRYIAVNVQKAGSDW
ncbi:MAG: hypothetical protein R2810_05045 [Flavobacteriales bacterium]